MVIKGLIACGFSINLPILCLAAEQHTAPLLNYCFISWLGGEGRAGGRTWMGKGGEG